MISPIMSNGVVAQTQNVNYINNNAEHHTDVVYQDMLANVESDSETARRTVIASDDSSETDTRHDAREEGKNKYSDNRDKSKKKLAEPEGIVKKKYSGGFDISI